MSKRQAVGPPIPPPPGPALRLSKIAIPRQYRNNSYDNNSYDTSLINIEKYRFKDPNEHILNVFSIIQNCGIAVPSIFGSINTLNEFQERVIKAFYYSFRVLLFYHYRKGGSLETAIKHRENILILDSNINTKHLIWQFGKSESVVKNIINKWHFLYYHERRSNRWVIFRDIRTLLLNDYAKYIISLLNISRETSIQLLTMLFYKTLSCSENSFLRLIKTLFSSLSNYYYSLLSQIAVEFVKEGNLPIETLRRLVDRWFPIFISQETPYMESLFVEVILSSPDQLNHFHTPSGNENCRFCSDSLLFLLSLIRSTRQFLSIIEKYPQASKMAFTLFIALAKDERFGESSLMLKAEATNAVVQLWLSSAKSHVMTLGPGVAQVLGEICRLQTIQINVWKSLVEDSIDDSGIKLLDVIISNSNSLDDLRIYREFDSIDYTLKVDTLYTLFSRKFLRPYCLKELSLGESNYYLAPLIVNYLTRMNFSLELKESVYGVLVKLLCEMTEKSPLAYLFSARLSLFIPWISLYRSTMIKFGIKGLFGDDLDVAVFNGDYLNKLSDNHIYDLKESKISYLALADRDGCESSITKILCRVMDADVKQGVALLDFLSHLAIYYYPSAGLTHLSLILSMYYELVHDGGEITLKNDKIGNIVDLISFSLGVKKITVTLKGLTGCVDEINKPLDYVISKKYQTCPNVEVSVTIQCDLNKSKMESPYLKLVLRHLLEFYIDRRINDKYYKHFYLTSIDLPILNDEKIGLVSPQMRELIVFTRVNMNEFHDIPTFLDVFIHKLLTSASESDIGFYEYASKMAGGFSEINFDEIIAVGHKYEGVGPVIVSHFIANLISIHIFGDCDDAFSRFTSCLSDYTLDQVINCLVHKKVISDDVMPFLMSESEFKSLVGDHKAVVGVTIHPFNMLTNNMITGNHSGSVGLLKWTCDWLLVTAKITSSMANLGSNKANNILNKIEKNNIQGALLSKISINDKRDLRVSTLLPYGQLDVALSKIADFLQATNNVEYVCAGLNILWNLVVSSSPRAGLVNPLISILTNVNSLMNNPHMMNIHSNNLNKLASMVIVTLLVWITADPLQSLITFPNVTPIGSPSSIIIWKNIENFIRYDMKGAKNLECKFNEVNLQFSDFTLPLAHKIFMGDFKM